MLRAEDFTDPGDVFSSGGVAVMSLAAVIFPMLSDVSVNDLIISLRT